MTIKEIDTVCAELGDPVSLLTEDGESSFYQFDGTDQFVAESIGELLDMGVRFMKLTGVIT